MNLLKLALSGLRHHRRASLGVIFGVMCATAVLVGALAVGDSVRGSLRDQASARIGRIAVGLVAADRYVPSDLAERLAGDLEGVIIAPTLALRGMASKDGGEAGAGIVNVFGVEDRFFQLAPQGGGLLAPPPEEAYVNGALAVHLGVKVGDTVLLRIENPGFLPRDMAMATIDDVAFALRVKVTRVVSDAEFGRFDLTASQVPPFNVLLNREWLGTQLKLPGLANAFFLGEPKESRELAARAQAALRQHLSLADLGLALRPLPDAPLAELASQRVFLDAPIVEAARALDVASAGVLTYFVNSLAANGRTTPYSMVSGVASLGRTPKASGPLAELVNLAPANEEDGMVLNAWLANDLKAKPGDDVALRYFIMGAGQQLVEESHRFTVERIVPMEGFAIDRTLMPKFPGLADAENCRDWEPGIPLDLKRIRDEDEAYWDRYEGAPKGFVSLASARELFSNRFGSLTAIRIADADKELFESELPRRVDPSAVGLQFRDIRTGARATGTSATDFGGLFLGLSFFLILAALLLTALLFVFGVEQRSSEIGLLLAVGWRPIAVARLLLSEGLVLACLGSLLGVPLGLGYTALVLRGLATLWRGAIGSATLTFQPTILGIAIGVFAAVLCALIAMAWTLRSVFRRSVVSLMSGAGAGSAVLRKESSRWPRVSALTSAALAVALMIFGGTQPTAMASIFFGAGALLLISGLLATRELLQRLSMAGRTLSVDTLAVRNVARRLGRSVATVALLASGVFLVVAVAANRLAPPGDATDRASGTGGFTLFGRSTLPVLRDLGTPEGRAALGLPEDFAEGVRVVAFRVKEGDDASCLNLSLPQSPRLLGVDAQALAERNAFTFVATAAPPGGEVKSPWSLLDADFGDGIVPAIGDDASVKWAMKKAVGESLPYVDEAGRVFQVKIVGTVAPSILQGSLIVAEKRLLERYPAVSGYREFLVDAPVARLSETRNVLSRALSDVGFEATSTQTRLAAFNEVQNTYLLIFQALGGLGLLLGSFGLGAVVLRNALERRGELAIAKVVGFSSATLRRMLFVEHGILLLAGLLVGVVAALIAVAPGLLSAGRSPLSVETMLLVFAVAVNGALWVLVASRAASRGALLGALRGD